MSTKWYKVTVVYVSMRTRTYALEARDAIAAVSTVLGWRRVAIQSGLETSDVSRIFVSECKEPSAIDAEGKQVEHQPNPMPVAE